MSKSIIDTTWLLQKALAARPGTWLLIISPRGQGQALAAEIKRLRPDLRVEVEEQPRERALPRSNGGIL